MALCVCCVHTPGMDILCSDKTGTLTLNKLSIDLAAVYPMAGGCGSSVKLGRAA